MSGSRDNSKSSENAARRAEIRRRMQEARERVERGRVTVHDDEEDKKGAPNLSLDEIFRSVRESEPQDENPRRAAWESSLEETTQRTTEAKARQDALVARINDRRKQEKDAEAERVRAEKESASQETYPVAEAQTTPLSVVLQKLKKAEIKTEAQLARGLGWVKTALLEELKTAKILHLQEKLYIGGTDTELADMKLEPRIGRGDTLRRNEVPKYLSQKYAETSPQWALQKAWFEALTALQTKVQEIDETAALGGVIAELSGKNRPNGALGPVPNDEMRGEILKNLEALASRLEGAAQNMQKSAAEPGSKKPAAPPLREEKEATLKEDSFELKGDERGAEVDPEYKESERQLFVEETKSAKCLIDNLKQGVDKFKNGKTAKEKSSEIKSLRKVLLEDLKKLKVEFLAPHVNAYWREVSCFESVPDALVRRWSEKDIAEKIGVDGINETYGQYKELRKCAKAITEDDPKGGLQKFAEAVQQASGLFGDQGKREIQQTVEGLVVRLGISVQSQDRSAVGALRPSGGGGSSGGFWRAVGELATSCCRFS